MFNRLISIQHFLGAGWRWNTLRGARLSEFQDRRARAMVKFAYERSPFYRQHWAGCDLADWQHLPVVDKAAMMSNFDIFNTLGVRRETAMQVALQAEQDRNFRPTLNGLTVGLSSGTSGHRGLFLVSAQERAMWAGVILARVLNGHLFKTGHRLRALRVAFFLRSNSNLYETTGRFIQFRYFDLMTPLGEAVTELNTFKPDILIGPPKLLDLLADYYRQGKLQIKPARVISVAEVLEPQDKLKLESAFGVRVDQIYQCTEGLLAVSCYKGALHLQEDLVAVQFEPLDDTNPNMGDRVTPIVTDLWRTTQPIVRYRLNDILRLSSPTCACGSDFRVIEAIEGRNDDICYFSGRAFFPDTIRKMILLADAAIEDYEAVQDRPGSLRIGLKIPSDANRDQVAAAVRGSVERVLAEYGCEGADIQIDFDLESTPLIGKRRRVRNTSRSRSV